ncbi:hypothetical protein REPUB_Repub04eG0160600 [Reevesia pubescens]
MTKDAKNVQRDTLKNILEENGCAEYLQNLGLNSRTDPESFKACVPLVTYKDLEPYIQRVVNGAYSLILIGKPITTISLKIKKNFSFYEKLKECVSSNKRDIQEGVN